MDFLSFEITFSWEGPCGINVDFYRDRKMKSTWPFENKISQNGPFHKLSYNFFSC